MLARSFATVTVVLVVAMPAMASHVFVLGDSLSAEDNVFLPDAWPVLAFPDAHRTNFAVSGFDTFDVLDRMDTWLPFACPGTEWYVLIGTNDAARIYSGTNPPGSYDTNMALIVLNLWQANVDTVHIIHSPRWFNSAGSEASNEGITSILADERDVTDVPLCDAYPNTTCGPDLWTELDPAMGDFLSDGIHLSAEGHARVVELLPEPSVPSSTFAGIVAIAIVRRRRERRG